MMLNEWGLAASPPVVPPGPTQTIKMTDGGSTTLAPAPAGTEVILTMPPKANAATVLWNRGVSEIVQGCYDMSGPCSLILDGNPGSILISWTVAPVTIPGQPTIYAPPIPPFTITIPGEQAQGGQLIPDAACGAGMYVNPAYLAEMALFGATSQPQCISEGAAVTLPPVPIGIIKAAPTPCPSGKIKDSVTGICLPPCWDGSAPFGNACPAQPMALPGTSTGTYVAVGAAGIVVLGGVIWWFSRRHS